MLDPQLIAWEAAAVAALSDLAATVTRRDIGYEPAAGFYHVDIAILPDGGEGMPLAQQTLDLDLEVLVQGRGNDGTLVLDRVRFFSDLTLERLYSTAALARLFANSDAPSYAREIQINNGAVMIREAVTIKCRIQHVVGSGPVTGIVEAFTGHLPAPIGAGKASLSSVAVYPASHDAIVVAPGDVIAIWAGATGNGTEELRLMDDTIVVASHALATARGQHLFPAVAAGDYSLIIHDTEGAAELARFDGVRLRAAP